MSKWTKTEVIQRIKHILGYPVVNIEIPDTTIEVYLDEAVDYINQYYSVVKFQEVHSTVYDMTPLKARAVLGVYRSPYADYADTDVDIFRAYQINNLGTLNVNDIQLAQGKISLYDSVKSEDWRFFEGKLYLYNFSGPCVVQYTSDSDFEDITEKKWQSWVRRYAVALTKIGLGRIRNKFSVTNIPVDVDGDTLIAEGQEEKAALEQQLIEQGEGLFYIERVK